MNNNTYVIRKKTSVTFMVIVLLLAFSNVFAPSGAAKAIQFSESFSAIALLGMLWLSTKSMPPILVNRWYGFSVASVVLMAVLSVMNYNAQAMQLCNMVTTFGIVFWVQLFSMMKWECRNLFSLGIAVCMLGYFLNYQFLPGQAWSGWNPNSSIGVVPIMFFGLACIWCSDYKFAHWLSIPIVLIYLSIISALDNRSAFYAVVAFCLLVLLRKPVLKKKWYRVVYFSIILLNVVVPFFNSFIVGSNFFNEIIGASSIGAEKMGGFNGREELWAMAVMYNAKSPIFGMYGVRPIYPHNFSMDLLVEYGWLGWLTFYGMVVAIMEKVFRENSRYNVFAIAFVSVIFLNTFENVFSCCNMFVVFTYMLPAVALCIHRSGQYEATGYKPSKM